MAIPANAYKSGAIVGKVESFIQKIMMVENEETPFYNKANKNVTTAVQPLHSWKTDELDVPGANAHLEGADFAGTVVNPATRLNNYTQIMKKEIVLTGTALATDEHGVSDQLVYQVNKKRKSLQRDVEFVLLNPQTPQDDNGTVPRQLRSFPGWLSSNVNAGDGGADGTDTAARTDGTTRAFSETQFRRVIDTNWELGGFASEVLMSLKQKRVFDTFTGNATRYIDATTTKAMPNVDSYQGAAGTYKVTLSARMRDREVFLIDPSCVGLAFLQNRNWKLETISKSGDSEKRSLIGEMTLVVQNEKAHGLIGDLS